MERNLANIISYIFHPLAMPLVTLFVVFQLGTYIQYTVSLEAKNMIYTIVVLNTFLVPAFTTFYLYKKKIVSSLTLEKRHERWFPYIMTAFLYCITYYLISQVVLPGIIHSIMLGVTLCVVAALLANSITKISIHAIGIGGLLGTLLAVSQKLLLDITLLIAIVAFAVGLVGYARLKLKAHSQLQYYAGAIVGFACLYLSVLYDLG